MIRNHVNAALWVLIIASVQRSAIKPKTENAKVLLGRRREIPVTGRRSGFVVDHLPVDTPCMAASVQCVSAGVRVRMWVVGRDITSTYNMHATTYPTTLYAPHGIVTPCIVSPTLDLPVDGLCAAKYSMPSLGSVGLAPGLGTASSDVLYVYRCVTCRVVVLTAEMLTAPSGVWPTAKSRAGIHGKNDVIQSYKTLDTRITPAVSSVSSYHAVSMNHKHTSHPQVAVCNRECV